MDNEFGLEERNIKKIEDEAYSEIAAVRKQLQNTKEALTLAIDVLEKIKIIMSSD